MALEADLTASAVGAITGGDIGSFVREVEYGVQKIGIDAATSSGSTDVHVELEHLVSFYNALSDLHTQLDATVAKFDDSGYELSDVDAGGHVSGVASAWKATAGSVGGASDSSLAANVRAVDAEVLKAMAALQHNAQQYAANENYAVRGLGKAAHVAASPDPAENPHSAVTTIHNSGVSGSGLGF